MALTASAKSAAELQNAANAGALIRSVEQLFTDPAFATKNNNFINDLNVYRDALNKKDLTTAGAMPTLTSAITAAELPVGEIVFDIYYYLGYMAVGTNKGIRIAVVSDDGSINYGPLIVETSQPTYDFSARDSYIWCASSVDGEPGVIRVNLGLRFGNDLLFAYTNDLYKSGVSDFTTTACAFMGDTNQLAFTTANNGTTDGAIYVENLDEKVRIQFHNSGKSSCLFAYINSGCNARYASGSFGTQKLFLISCMARR